MLKMLLLFASSLILLAGCAGSHSTVASATDKPCAECLVCKKNADLACVDVVIDEKTPRYEHAGKTFYFCSEECRTAFAAHPDRYVSTASR